MREEHSPRTNRGPGLRLRGDGDLLALLAYRHIQLAPFGCRLGRRDLPDPVYAIAGIVAGIGVAAEEVERLAFVAPLPLSALARDDGELPLGVPFPAPNGGQMKRALVVALSPLPATSPSYVYSVMPLELTSTPPVTLTGGGAGVDGLLAGCEAQAVRNDVALQAVGAEHLEGRNLKAFP